MDSIDTLVPNQPPKKGKGGFRPNSGRKKGSKDRATLERLEAEKIFKDRVLKAIHPLINSQLTLARGVNYLYKIEKTTHPKGGTTKSKPILVTNQAEIEAYLAGDYDDEEDVYYYITTDKPENKALDSLLDRVFGKAVESVKLSNPDGTPLAGPTIYLPGIKNDYVAPMEAEPRSPGAFPPVPHV